MWTWNRSICAMSGTIGKYVAKGIDSIGKAAGLEPAVVTEGRKVVGQFAAFAMAHMGAPEAALSVLSSIAVSPYDPVDLPGAQATNTEPAVDGDVDAVDAEATE